MQLAKIYHFKGRLEEFVEVIFPPVQKTLIIQFMNQKLKARSNKRLSKSVLFERVKLLDDRQEDNVFCGFKPVATSADLEQKNYGQVRYCLSKAIAADPKDLGLRFDRALLYFELGEYQKVVDSYDQILGLYPANVEARKMASKMHQKCRQLNKGIGILEDYVNDHSVEADASVFDLLISLHMENSSYNNAVQLIEKANSAFGSGGELPFCLKARKAICHAHLGNMEIAKDFFQDIPMEHFEDHYDLVNELADNFLTLGHSQYALKLYFILDKTVCNEKEALYNIARAYQHVGFVTFAALYYEKVFAIQQIDLPNSKLTNQDTGAPANHKLGYRNLHMEAAFNLHLIYKKSGAVDLSRRILKSYCTT